MSKMPQIIKSILLGMGIGIYILSLLHYPVYSNTVLQLQEEITRKEKEIAEKESVLQGVERRIKEISSSNYSLSQKINLLNEEIQTLEKNIAVTEEEREEKVKGIEEKQGQLEKTKVLIDDISGDLYIQSRYKLTNFFLNGANWFTIVESLYVRKSAISTLKKEIEKIGGEFSSLAERKAELDKEKEDLDKQKEGLDEAHKLLAEEKAKVQAELNREVASKSGLNAQIGGIKKELSGLQQTLLAVRGGLNLSTANIPSSNADPTSQLAYFLANAPSGSFGIFSFGASTHRNGMSQWGAWERAQQGQSYIDILSFYYSNHSATIREDGKVSVGHGEEPITSTIKVDGYANPLSFEDEYMMGIREIHPIFNKDNEKDMNNLKAQAIAARTFALNYTKNGTTSICPTQGCQVYSTDRFTGAWEKAVRETRGVTMKNSDGNAFSAQYSSVTGGWINNGIKYDVMPGSGYWAERAYEGMAGVDWFHKAWYQMKGSNDKYSACSTQPYPWLTGKDLADILNAYLYFTDPNSSSSDPRFLSPDHNICFGGGNPYTPAELQSLVPNAVVEVLSAEAINNEGWTTAINFTVKRVGGGISGINITGKQNTRAFKDIFNIRAPGFFSIPQHCNGCESFVHINIVKK